MGLKMGKIFKMIFKIIKYLILNSILGLVVSVFFLCTARECEIFYYDIYGVFYRRVSF